MKDIEHELSSVGSHRVIQQLAEIIEEFWVWTSHFNISPLHHNPGNKSHPNIRASKSGPSHILASLPHTRLLSLLRVWSTLDEPHFWPSAEPEKVHRYSRNSYIGYRKGQSVDTRAGLSVIIKLKYTIWREARKSYRLVVKAVRQTRDI